MATNIVPDLNDLANTCYEIDDIDNAPEIPVIYALINKANGKFYLGSAESARDRWRMHRYALNGGYHRNGHLKSSWKNHGKDNFYFRILEVVTELPEYEGDDTYLTDVEQQWLDAYDYDYNICKFAGSTKGIKYSDEARRNVSESLKGRKLSPERCKQISEYQKGRKKPQGHGEKISELKKGVPRSEEMVEKIKNSFTEERREAARASIIARTQSEEVRKKLSENRRKSGHNKEGNWYKGVDPSGNEVIFRNAKDFARKNNLTANCIYDCCKGVAFSHKGWTFERYKPSDDKTAA